MIQSISDYLTSHFSENIINQEKRNSNIPHFYIKPEGLLSVLRGLKEHKVFSFTFLNDLTAVDWLSKRTPRFEVIYLLRSPKNKHLHIQLRVPVDLGEEIPSVTSIFKGANWPEREVFDLFGIRFKDHPYLERIVLPDNFIGHPLRKDYPLEGPGQDYLIENLLQIHIHDDISKEA
jgi:NADH-quinone oxidoreductase subunit C